MTKLQRVLNVLAGLFMIAIGLLLLIDEPNDGMKFVLFFIQAGMTLHGLRLIHYYLTMARYMVGGRTVLYRAMIYLDLGTLAGSLFDHPAMYTITYLALFHAFRGAVNMLRANESRNMKAQWRLKMALGVTELLLAILIIVIAAAFGRIDAAVYVYGAGLIYSAGLRIAHAFRRTDIVYIQ